MKDSPRRHKVQYPDITKPIPVPEVKELRAPLPEPKKQADQQRRWDWYMKRRQWRDYVQKERPA